MASIGATAQANTAWNITNSSAARITRPHTGCITQRIDAACGSGRDVQGAAGATAASRRRTSCCSCSRRQRGGSASGHLEVPQGRPRAEIGSAASSCGMAVVAHRHRLHHRAAQLLRPAAAVSMARPCDRVPRPPCSTPPASAGPGGCSSSTRRRFMRRLVASTTATMRSGTVFARCAGLRSPRASPASSGVAGVQAVGAGQVDHRARMSPIGQACQSRSLRSTVTPA